MRGRSGHWRGILTEEWQLVRDFCASVDRGEALPAHPFVRIETVTPDSLAQSGVPLPGVELFLPGGGSREALHVKSARYEVLVAASRPPKLLQLRPGPNLYRGFPVADFDLEWKHDPNLEPSPSEDSYRYNVADEWASVFEVRPILSCPTFKLHRERSWSWLIDHVAKHYAPALRQGRDLDPIRNDLRKLSISSICPEGCSVPLRGPEPLVAAFVTEVAAYPAAHPHLFAVMPPDRLPLARELLAEALAAIVFPPTPEEELRLVTAVRQDALTLAGINIPANYVTWEPVCRCIADRIYPLIDQGERIEAVRSLLVALTNHCLALASSKTAQKQLKFLLERIRSQERLRESDRTPVEPRYRLEDLLPPGARSAMDDIWNDENEEFILAQHGY